jgi:hypothetical protein
LLSIEWLKKITFGGLIDQLSSEIDNRSWRTQFGDARHRDQESLERLLGELMQNQDILFKQLFHKLDTQQTSLISMMSAMQKASHSFHSLFWPLRLVSEHVLTFRPDFFIQGILKLNIDDNRLTERRFLEQGVSLLQRRSGQSVEIESWFVSSLEVDKGDKVGSGGFSTVYKATFLGSPVAVKELAVTTSSKASCVCAALWRICLT